jgi:hypothetical protein
VVVLGHGLWTFGRHSSLTLRSPWSRDYGEGCVLGMAQLAAARGNYFPDLADYPYLVANYPPVFVAATALGQKAFGPSLFFPRLLALLATLALVAVLFRALRARLDAATALALAAVFAMPWFVTTWAALARVDTTAILFSLAGLALVLRRGVTKSAWPALVFFWLAFFTKQNALLAPAAVLLDLALAHDRRFLRACLAYVLPLALLLGLLVAATGGAAWQHLVPYTAAADYEPGRMAESYQQFAVIASPLLLLVAAALVLRPRAFLAAGDGRVLLLYFILNLAALSTIAKAGAAQNYFLEPWLATLLLAGHALRQLGDAEPVLREWRFAVLLVAAAVANYAYPALDRLPQALRAPQNAEEFRALTKMIRETPGDLLSENLSMLVVNRRPVLVEPFGVLLIARHGLLRTDRMVADCERGRFPLVVTEHRMWEIPGLGECLERRYQPIGDFGPYQALRPRPAIPGGAASLPPAPPLASRE